MEFQIRKATIDDIGDITKIYNEGIEDRIATLETRLRDEAEMIQWLNTREERYKVLVIHDDNKLVCGWASINVFNSRCCYSGVGDISIYIAREHRGKGLGKTLLQGLVQVALKEEFHKLILSTFDFNKVGHKLYKSLGFREVGTYMEQGILDGKFVNITIMEKLL
jgi:L-amino acid N-acyltransferase YncA